MGRLIAPLPVLQEGRSPKESLKEYQFSEESSNSSRKLQNLLIAHATGDRKDDGEYVLLRQKLISNKALAPLLPQFLQTCRNLDQFWQLIKSKFKTYAERKNQIWEEFNPLFEAFEQDSAPSDKAITESLGIIDPPYVQAAWAKAIERRSSDPEGAITSARTLIESVCKHILDESKTQYEDDAELPKLYKHTAEVLNLAPSQHTDKVFRQILGSCTSIVEGLGSLRNRLSDAHGKGKIASKPASRHAELAVNLSGALAMYLLATWETKESNY